MSDSTAAASLRLRSEASADFSAVDTTPSLVEIKAALPPSVFQSSLVKSMYYVVQDVCIVAGLFAFAHFVCRPYPILWPLYYFTQGTMFWALFVLGHDCGHGSFSSFNLVNDIVGIILHSFILVPFYSWKLSHRAHHKNTGNIDRDEIFFPVKRSELVKATGADTSGLLFTRFYFGLGLGWFLYLLEGYHTRKMSHFNVMASLFTGKALKVAISLVVYCCMLALLTFATMVYGYEIIINYYFVPLLVFASWLVVVTFLHHNDIDVPWYTDSNWTYVKGNLSSVDRDYGWVHRITHNIGTHQIHHLFPAIPHYRLEEATAAFRRSFPHLVRRNDDWYPTSFMKQFRIFGEQHVIDDDVEIFQYSAQK